MAYIDKDLLLKDIDESVVFSVREGKPSLEIRGARKIIDRIENAPTADVVEVKHGKWIKPTSVSQEYCNQCGLTPKMIFGILPDYCPHCGAKMDGKDINVRSNERSDNNA